MDAQTDAGMEEGLGLQVEFESFPELELAFESLARENRGIEVLNVRHDEKITRATVFVPDGKLAHFEELIVAYLARNGQPRSREGCATARASGERCRPLGQRQRERRQLAEGAAWPTWEKYWHKHMLYQSLRFLPYSASTGITVATW